MSDSEPEVRIRPKVKKTTPVADEYEINEAHAQLIAEFVNSPIFKIMKRVIAPQHQDKISREALAQSTSHEQTMFYKGRVYEVKAWFKAMEKIKKAYADRNTESSERKFKK